MKEIVNKYEPKPGDVMVHYDPERLRALTKYMGDKGLCLEDEIVKQIEHLFIRYVPPSVKEYLDYRAIEGQSDS